ncbi:MAG: 2OG-Fe(II) oxygenase family protein [Candidatus Obscuribacterales bacterium]|nr:2OG-Fe(II) oxygenase family protein [Candidatus Obscuribacterales bacterium]
MNTEKAIGAVSPDPKEFFHFYRDGQCPNSCIKTSREVFERISAIAVATFSQIAEEVPVLKKFTEEIATSNRLVLRIARYFGEDAEYFNAPHDDIDFITILPRATKKGFEVLENGIWKGVMAAPDQGIALCGEMLTEATAGQIKPLRHRVVASAGERYSMSYFMNPDDNVQLSPQWKAGDMLKDRLQEIYL